jgi:SAM-dependent methyltransferase
MNEVYENPKYYEIAFSYRNIPDEVDVLERVIKQFSQIPVSTVLDLACGPAPYVEELVRREYHYIGLDRSPAMLEYAQTKAKAINTSARFQLADMTNFELVEVVDFVFVLLGSLQARNTPQIVSHFDSVSRVLKPGGLYFLDWCIAFSLNDSKVDSWEMIQDQIKVKATFQTKLIDPVEQVYQESLSLEVEDQDTRKVLREVDLQRWIYPQEFLLFIAARNDFEFVGWWNNWDLLQPLPTTRQINRPITLLIRR